MAEIVRPKVHVNTVVPERFKFPKKTLELAQTKLTDDMVYADVKKILAAKTKMEHLFAVAAVYHIKATTGRDLTKELPHWRGHEVTLNGGFTGNVTVVQYLYDERAPRKKFGEWTFTKKMLLNTYK